MILKSGVGKNPRPAGTFAAHPRTYRSDVAISAADMILLRDDLRTVPDAIGLARAAFRTIRHNLAWAFCYNVAAVPLAALGLLNPSIASAAMTLSSLFVVANSLRLQRYALRTASETPVLN